MSFWTLIGSSAANGRPSLMEIPYLPPLFMARSDQGGATDYSRPPPPGSQSSAGGPSPIPGNNSCFNCGASGHRGTQCQQITFDEIINPSPVWGQVSHYQTHIHNTYTTHNLVMTSGPKWWWTSKSRQIDPTLSNDPFCFFSFFYNYYWWIYLNFFFLLNICCSRESSKRRQLGCSLSLGIFGWRLLRP
jgi:hypothetical protein